jgi:GGDEF domain-containing protein
MAEPLRRERNRRRPIGPHSFIERLTDEIERCRRYGRTFALLLLQAPTTADHSDRLKVLRTAVTVAGRLVRNCDILGSFEKSALLVVLLPETGPSGARIVLQRLSSLMGDTGDGCIIGLATYRENRDVIEYFLERSEQMVESDVRLEWTGKDLSVPAVG